MDIDSRVRAAAFSFLAKHVELQGGHALPRKLLERGFELEGDQVPLIGPPGIFKPRVLPEVPLSINTTAPVAGKPQPYNDGPGEDGILRYRYRGSDPMHRDNVGLRIAMRDHKPLIYFLGIVPGKYLAFFPVFVVGDDPKSLAFSVDLAETSLESLNEELSTEIGEARRAYVAVVTTRRLHQEAFRERVLKAYRECCAVCQLRQPALLEAAHILPDRHPQGEPRVSNGLALCKLHHAAFDQYILGIRPDLIVELRSEILSEIDGPMLKHGLQGFQGSRLRVVPFSEKQRPNPDFLAERYAIFRKAG